MQPRVPSGSSDQDQLNKSFGLVLAGNVSPGNGLTFAGDGTPLTFSPDNTVGIMIRIGSTANPNGLAASWPGPNADLTIAHNLNSVPTGFILTASYAAANVFFGTVAPTATNITLQTSNADTDTTIWILI